MLQRIPMWTILLVTIAFSLYRLQPPNQDRDGFSTARAMEDLRFIASETRPVGSPHHQAVRNMIVERFQRLGFEVQLQTAHSPIPLINILARKPGTASDHRAIALAAHYDSSANGPGAGDDGAAVVALLEVANLLSQSAHRQDLIFLITDGEELGLWGARIFVNQEHSWLTDISAVLNFDARGSSGPSVMFETSPKNGWLIDLFARLSPHPVCSSFTGDAYRLMPNRTDFTIFNEDAHLEGLNFAFIGGLENYHQPTDDLDHLDLRSLRHHGIQALALAKALLDLDLSLPCNSRETIYFDVASFFVLRYPKILAPFIAIVAAGLAVIAITLALRNRLATPRRIGISLGMLCLNLLCVAGIAKLIVLPLTIAIGTAVYASFAIVCSLAFMAGCRRCTIFDRACAAVIFWMALALALGLVQAGSSYLFVWPLAGASIGMLLLMSRFVARRSLIQILILSVAALPALLLLTPLIYLAFQGLTLKLAWAVCLPVVLGVWLLALQINYSEMRKSDGIA